MHLLSFFWAAHGPFLWKPVFTPFQQQGSGVDSQEHSKRRAGWHGIPRKVPCSPCPMDGPIKVLVWIFFYAESMENFLDITVTLGAMAQALPAALALVMERAGMWSSPGTERSINGNPWHRIEVLEAEQCPCLVPSLHLHFSVSFWGRQPQSSLSYPMAFPCSLSLFMA